jgi:peroxiredoxin family protein
MKPVDFRTSSYFSGTFIFVGIFLVFVGLLVLTKTLIGGLALLLISSILFTTHYRLTIDFDNKRYHDYLWILGMKHGEKGKFETIDYLFIKKSKEVQTMNSRASSATIKKDVFDGYLKFSEKDKIHLMTKGSKKDLIQQMKSIASKLSLDVMDYSEGVPTKA